MKLTLSFSGLIGINALDAYCMAYNAIGVLRQQTLPSNRIHSIITNGGQATNSKLAEPMDEPNTTLLLLITVLSCPQLSQSWSQVW